MKIRRIHAFLFLLTILCSEAGAQSLDSLLASYNKTSDSVTKKTLSLQIGRHYLAANAYNKAIEYLESALSNPTHLNDIPVLKNIAYCYHELGNHNEEIGLYEKILHLTEAKNDTTQLVETMQTLSGLMEQAAEYDKAIALNKRILTVAEKQKNYRWASISLNNLGYLYSIKNMQMDSEAYFNQSYTLAKQPNTQIPDDLRASILINLGVSNARLQKYKEAKQYLTEAYEIRLTVGDKIKIAEALNYLASFDFIQNNIEKARQKVMQSIEIVNQVEPSPQKDNTLLACYKLMSQIMLKANNQNEYRRYTEAATALQQKIIEHDRRSIKLLLQQQIDVEKKEAAYKVLVSENEVKTSRLRQSELERDKKERELELQLRQLDILKKENELQASRYSNQRLENEKINQQLELIQQQATVAEQEQSIKLLHKESELKNLSLAQRKIEIERLELEKKQSAKLRLSGIIIILLLLLLLLISIFGYRIRVKRNRLLTLQYETIRQLNDDLQHQNEELKTINEQIAERTSELHIINTQLDQAKQIVEQQNKQLQMYAQNLEGEVENRTKEIIQKNLELVQYTNQLEEFTYTVSHNIRAPIARLQGLLALLDFASEHEREGVLAMLRSSSKELDFVVTDLHEILTIKDQKVVTEPVYINEDIVTLVNEFQNKHPEVTFNIQISINQIQGVKSYYESILRNLIDNAIKFRATNRPAVVSVSIEHNQGYTTLTVADNGIGFELDRYRDKLFKFYTRMNTAFGGKGLGLYRVKTQADAMNATIHINSNLDKGTTVQITVPDP